MKHVATLLVVTWSVACGPPPPLPPSGPAPLSEPKTEESPNAETCAGAKTCTSIGLALKKRGEVAGARTALRKACAEPEYVVDACAALVALMMTDNRGGERFAIEAEHGCSQHGLEETSDKEARGLACVLLGDGYRYGHRVPKDNERALRAYAEGCALGAEHGCNRGRHLQQQLNDAQTKPPDDAGGVPDATVRVANVTTDGVTVEQIACKTEGGVGLGLLGALVLGKPFADKKRALDACSKTAHKTRVRWVAKDGRMTEVKVIAPFDGVGEEDPSNKCIERTMTGAVAPIPGTCAATLVIGRAAKK